MSVRKEGPEREMVVLALPEEDLAREENLVLPGERLGNEGLGPKGRLGGWLGGAGGQDRGVPGC